MGCYTPGNNVVTCLINITSDAQVSSCFEFLSYELICQLYATVVGPVHFWNLNSVRHFWMLGHWCHHFHSSHLNIELEGSAQYLKIWKKLGFVDVFDFEEAFDKLKNFGENDLGMEPLHLFALWFSHMLAFTHEFMCWVESWHHWLPMLNLSWKIYLNESCWLSYSSDSTLNSASYSFLLLYVACVVCGFLYLSVYELCV